MPPENFIAFVNQSNAPLDSLYQKEDHFQMHQGKGYKKLSENKIIGLVSAYLKLNPSPSNLSYETVKNILTSISQPQPKNTTHKIILYVKEFFSKIKNFLLFRGFHTSHFIAQKRAQNLLHHLSIPAARVDKKEKKKQDYNLWNKTLITHYHCLVKQQYSGDALFTWSRYSDGNIRPSTLGLTQIANLLKARHHFEDHLLHVCPSLQNLSQKLKALEKLEGDQRIAFIVPTHSSLWGHDQTNVVPKRTETSGQHIIAVVAEKIGNALHIALLDPMIRLGNETITPSRIGLEKETDFSEQELILSHILTAELNPDTTTLYYSGVLREKSNGCWVFALKDAVNFLKHPYFFTEVGKNSPTSQTIGKLTLKKIETLPADFMKVAQFSPSDFEAYLRLHPEQDTPKFRKKIAKHQIGNQNWRVGRATVKWMKVLTAHSDTQRS
ncbi:MULTISPECIES: hypothetical protein [Parachlamydia]|jgi:hypothetical protein|uniref:hypothetical protein n=1 Tax=Parachlamydia TaxID=83551 RepID=UPI0024E207D0|nr:hypothetical protein [Parachlamydia acanthamoebae]